MHERISTILGRTISGIVVAERTIGDRPFEVHPCFTDGTTYEIHSEAPEWGHQSANFLSMIVDRISATAALTVHGDAALDRPAPRKRRSRGIAFRIPILQILREHGGKAL